MNKTFISSGISYDHWTGYAQPKFQAIIVEIKILHIE
jgi:hypothetical protein